MWVYFQYNSYHFKKCGHLKVKDLKEIFLSRLSTHNKVGGNARYMLFGNL